MITDIVGMIVEKNFANLHFRFDKQYGPYVLMQSENWNHWEYQLHAATNDYKFLSFKKWFASITLVDNEFLNNDYTIACHVPLHRENQRHHEQMEGVFDI